MLIRNAVPNDYDRLKALWLHVFGDDEDYIESFLCEKWKGDNCLIVEKQGIIVSMLFLLHAEIIANGRRSPVWYIYACATESAFRGMGCMKMLLEEACREALSQSVFALILVPASEKLFRYYEKAGFQRLYKRPVVSANIPESNQENRISEQQLERILVRRDTMLNRELDVCWDSEHLAFAIGDGAMASLTPMGYIIEEIDLNGKRKIVEQLPEMLESIGHEDYAMIRFCASYDLKTLEHSPYFNLALD